MRTCRRLALTQNAPPAPLNRVQTTFDRIDNHLNEVSGWRYEVRLEFDGTFAGTHPADQRLGAG
ncbi:MAG: hypothetical protein IPK19_15650 [Chloroflexi bacterium]|nr:hypothetical protein [Chloroflexota bacterium]